VLADIAHVIFKFVQTTPNSETRRA